MDYDLSNNSEQQAPFSMSGDGSVDDVQIPAVFMSKTAAQKLEELLRREHTNEGEGEGEETEEGKEGEHKVIVLLTWVHSEVKEGEEEKKGKEWEGEGLEGGEGERGRGGKETGEEEGEGPRDSADGMCFNSEGSYHSNDKSNTSPLYDSGLGPLDKDSLDSKWDQETDRDLHSDSKPAKDTNH